MQSTINPPESMLPPDFFARGLGLNQLLAIVLAYRKPIAIAAVSAMLVAGLFSKFVLSKSYDASATVLVDYEVPEPGALASGAIAALALAGLRSRRRMHQDSPALDR